MSDSDKLRLEIAKSIREDYLQQNAFDAVDAHSSLEKQYKILSLIIDFYEQSLALFDKGIIDFAAYYKETQAVRGKIARVKFVSEEGMEAIDAARRDMQGALETIRFNLREDDYND